MAAKFTRRHYEAIADVLRGETDNQAPLFSLGELARIVDKLTLAFKQDNPAFDADRFRVACGFTRTR